MQRNVNETHIFIFNSIWWWVWWLLMSGNRKLVYKMACTIFYELYWNIYLYNSHHCLNTGKERIRKRFKALLKLSLYLIVGKFFSYHIVSYISLHRFNNKIEINADQILIIFTYMWWSCMWSSFFFSTHIYIYVDVLSIYFN